jgi:hypothetical protein
VTGNDQHLDGRTGTTGASNVVPLRPRQWLESGDELVPIGGLTTESRVDPSESRADPPTGDAEQNGLSPASGTSSNGSEGHGHAASWLGPDEQTVPIRQAPPNSDSESPTTAWAASDFWGEDAALVHDALEAPAPASSTPMASSSGAELGPGATPVVGRYLTSRRHGLLRPPALAAITITAVAVVAVATTSLASAPPAPRRSTPPAAISAATNPPTRSTPSKSATTTTPARPRAAAADRLHRTSSRTQLHRRSSSTTSHRRPQHERHRTVVTATATHYVAAASASAPAPSTTAPATDSTATSTHSTSASSPSHVGPTGPISLIGSGTSPSG